MLYLLTCQKWLEQVTKKEIQQLGYKCRWSNTAIYIDGDEAAMARINLRSRCGNKLYIIADEAPVWDFDQLFDFVSSVDRSKYHAQNVPIVLSIVTHESSLTSVPAIQSIAQKAIFKKLQNTYNVSDRLEFDENLESLEIRILIQQNKASVMVNTSWESLQKRWYRSSSWIAPINESLASGIIHMTGWKFSDIFLDPCCGSGTIAIEAAMIAKRIAPWMNRNFIFENRAWYDKKYLQDAKVHAESVIIKDKKYQIYGSDNDLSALWFAKENAIRAGVDDAVVWIHKDLTHWKNNNLLESNYSIVTNPPYGSRMWNTNSLDQLYSDLVTLCDKSVTSSIITSFEWIDNYVWHKRSFLDIYNWWLACRIYKKK